MAGPASACAAAVAGSASACAAAVAGLLDGGAAGAWGPQAGSGTSRMGVLLCTADADANEEEVGGGLVLVEGLYSAERAAAAAAAEAAVADLLDAAAACLGTNLGLTGAPAITSLLQDFLIGSSNVHSLTLPIRQTDICKRTHSCQQVHSSSCL